MNKKLLFVGLLLFIVFTSPAVGFRARTPKYTLLRDGFALNGVDGKLVPQGSGMPVEEGGRRTSGWSLELESDVNDLRVLIPAGTKLELLPSSALEQMIAGANESAGAYYRLWGWVTKYEDRNYIFVNIYSQLRSQTPSHVQPREADKPSEKPPAEEAPEKSAQPQEQEKAEQSGEPGNEAVKKPAVNEPGDLLALPEGMVEKLEGGEEAAPEKSARPQEEEKVTQQGGEQAKEAVKKPAINEPGDLLSLPAGLLERLEEKKPERPVRRIVRREGTKRVKPQPDSILSDRTAFLTKTDDGGLTFVLDSLGWDVRPVSLPLLPSEALEVAERRQSAVPNRLRFKISGVITNYDGQKYLLLQKATRVYNYGNFGG